MVLREQTWVPSGNMRTTEDCHEKVDGEEVKVLPESVGLASVIEPLFDSEIDPYLVF